MKAIKVTQLEKTVLEALANQMYAELGFSDVGINEISRSTKLENKVLRGVASSLIQKGFLFIDEREDEGYGHIVDMHIWYLTGGMEGLVQEWVEYEEQEPIKLITE